MVEKCQSWCQNRRLEDQGEGVPEAVGAQAGGLEQDGGTEEDPFINMSDLLLLLHLLLCLVQLQRGKLLAKLLLPQMQTSGSC